MHEKRVILAEYFTTDDKTLLFIVRKDFDKPEIAEIMKSQNEIRQFITEHIGEQRKDNESGQVLMKISGQKVRRLDEKTFQDFFEPFVSPLLSKSPQGDQITNNGDIIWFVPHDMLHYIPMHAIKIDGRYVIDRNPVCYTPSASVMRFCHIKRKGRRQKALVVGDSLNDLKFASQEAISVAGIFNTNAYLHSEATKSFIKEKLKNDDIDILHLACHGVFDPTAPLKSHIVLAPEIKRNGNYVDKANEEKWNLTAEEIFGMKIHVDLVTLSSCESGVNDRKPGDELIGLTRSLIYAGTPSVIVSLWEVDDFSTSLIMQRFYQELQRGTKNGESPITKAEAMQSAQNHVRNMNTSDVIDISRNMELQVNNNLRHMKPIYKDTSTNSNLSTDRNSKPFEKMYYWAPFILVGDWK